MPGASSGPAFARAAAYRSEPIYRLTHRPTLLASPHLANRNAKHKAVKGRERQDMIGSMSFSCDNDSMSEIYAIWCGGHTRKFENFWIFELACGPGFRKCENQKFTDVCENLPMLAKICRFCENLQIFAKICTFLRKSAHFCENLQIFAIIYIFCENLHFFCENLPFCAKICRFFENLQIFCENW